MKLIFLKILYIFREQNFGEIFMKIEGIQSEEELKKAQAAAQAQGSSVSDYNDWDQILKEFEEYGVESTGSYAGDKAKMEEIRVAVEEYVEKIQAEQQIQQQIKPENNEDQKVQKSSETDKQQDLKATVANGTSSQIMADYMKYYHMLM